MNLDRGKSSLYIFWGITLLLLVLSYFLLRPYFIALISAFILAYLSRPIHKRLEKKFGKSVAAFISILSVVLIVILPLAFVVGNVVNQSQAYVRSDDFDSLVSAVFSLPLLETFELNLESVTGAGSPVVSFLTNLVFSFPSFLVSLFIVIMGMYYILISWDSLSRSLINYIPFRKKKEVVGDISRVTNIIVYGTLLIALIEFAVASVGFYLIGNEYYLILGALIFFFAFIPALGPTIVWVPLSLFYFLTGNTVQGIGVLIIGLILSAGIDSAFRARALGNRSRINPLIMLVGIFGGISVFGVFGFVIGPMVLAYTLEILEEIALSASSA